MHGGFVSTGSLFIWLHMEFILAHWNWKASNLRYKYVRSLVSLCASPCICGACVSVYVCVRG